LKVVAKNHFAVDAMIGEVVAPSFMVGGVKKRLKIVAEAGGHDRGAGQNPVKWVGARADSMLLEVIGGMAKGAE